LVPVPIPKKLPFSKALGSERVIRSDVGEAHRLSLSARVLSAQSNQVKAKTAVAEALPARFEIGAPGSQSIAKSLHRLG
jgi:hypothetical protein